MKSLFSYGFLVLCFCGALVSPPRLESANLASTKDVLSTSRLSVHARVDITGTIDSSSNVKIQAAAGLDTDSLQANTITTGSLKIGDTLKIGGSPEDHYTVVGIVDTLNFTVSPVINPSHTIVDNNPIYLKVRPTHTVTFTTATAILNGSFRVLIPADPAGAGVWTDGKPDAAGFDFTASPTVTATLVSGSGYTFSAGTGTVSGGVGCTATANYHCYDVAYTGTGGIGAVVQIVISTNAPIAPAPGNTTLGVAETYQYIVQNLDSGSGVIDSTKGKVALIEPVRVTASVDPTISMTICGDTDCADNLVNPGDVVDGETLSNNTGATSNATAVALGTLDLAAPRLQAQEIEVATNGSGGYALTAIDDGNLRKGADDINDNVTPPTVPAVLNTPGTESYGIHPCGTHVTAGTWGAGSDTCAGGATTNKYSGTDASTSVTLSSNSGPTNLVRTYVTYKANISSVTPQGNYEHSISYIATATF